MPISCYGDNGQSGQLTEQARGRPVNQAHQQVQEYGAIDAHHQIQTQPISRIEAPLQKIRKNQQHIEDYSLHRVEPNVPAEIRVSDDDEVQSEKH